MGFNKRQPGLDWANQYDCGFLFRTAELASQVADMVYNCHQDFNAVFDIAPLTRVNPPDFQPFTAGNFEDACLLLGLKYSEDFCGLGEYCGSVYGKIPPIFRS